MGLFLDIRRLTNFDTSTIIILYLYKLLDYAAIKLPKYTNTAMKIINSKAYLKTLVRISPSLPLNAQAAQPIAILCGASIFPAPVPSELAAASQ